MGEFRDRVATYFENWNRSELPLMKRSAVAAKNLSKRLRGERCCGHHGEAGC